jgi:hypothetical protein
VAASESTQAETEYRVAQLTALIANGGKRSDCIRYASDQGWNVTSRTIDNYLGRSRDQIRADWDLERPQLIAQMLTRLQRYESEAAAEKQYATAVQAVITAARLVQILK